MQQTIESLITLQRIENTEVFIEGFKADRRIVRHHMLQLTELPSGAAQLTVNGAEKPGLEKALEQLFDSIEVGITRKGLDLLKSILPDKK